jgi:hypothetical protein
MHPRNPARNSEGPSSQVFLHHIKSIRKSFLSELDVDLDVLEVSLEIGERPFHVI